MDCFLLSSAFGDDTPWIKRFHHDLERGVQVRDGASMTGVLSARPGTAPTDSPGRGIGAVAQLPVMVALCCDDYFDDPWCGQEWAVFTERLRSGAPATDAAEAADAEVPRLLPITWRRGQASRWPKLNALTDSSAARVAAELGESYAALDLYTLLRTHPQGEDGYFGVVRAIARQVSRARKAPLPVLSTETAKAVPPAFGQRGEAAVAASPRRHNSVWRQPQRRLARTDAPAGWECAPDRGETPAKRPRPKARSRPATAGRVAVSYVGANQPWADWIRQILVSRGHRVDLIRWNALGGERLSATLEKAERSGAERLICVLSREYCVTRSDPGAGVTELEQWELLGDGAPLGSRIQRVVIDREPLPEPLRSMPFIDLRVGSATAVTDLLTQIGEPRGSRPADAHSLPARGPDSLPPVIRAPVENDFFIGRDDDLDRIAELLDRDGRTVVVAEGARSDMGESEVAVEYSYRFRMRYDLIWWISCRPDDDIPGQLRDLAARSTGPAIPESADPEEGRPGDIRPPDVEPPRPGPPHSQPPQPEPPRSESPQPESPRFGPGRYEPIRYGSRRLLVFVGAGSPDEVEDHLPDDDTHVVVVAGTPGSWDRWAVPIRSLSRAESILLLTETTMVNPSEANQLAELLGDRPGLISEVAGYLVRRDVSLSSCLALLTTSRQYDELPLDLYLRLLTMSLEGLAGRDQALPPAGRTGAARAASNGSAAPSSALVPLDSRVASNGRAAPPEPPTPATSSEPPEPPGSPEPPEPANLSESPESPEPPESPKSPESPGSPEPSGPPGYLALPETSSSPPGIDLTDSWQDRAPARYLGQRDVPRAFPAPETDLLLSERDQLRIYAALIHVWDLQQPDTFDAWVTEVSRRLGRRVLLPVSEPLTVRVMALVRHALAQPGPGTLDTMVQALEARDPADPSVRQFRWNVENARSRWGQPAGGERIDSRFLVEQNAEVTVGDPDERPPYFFLSYARRPDRDLVEFFHRRLEVEIGRRISREVNSSGFLDRLSLEGGAHWRAELREAARSSSVMIALCSDDYFTSDWCGREWAVFQERINRATPPGGVPPAAIIPLPWLPLTRERPEPVRDVQMMSLHSITTEDLPVMDLIQEDDALVRRLMRLLVERMMKITASALPPLPRDVTGQIAPLFGEPSR